MNFCGPVDLLGAPHTGTQCALGWHAWGRSRRAGARYLTWGALPDLGRTPSEVGVLRDEVWDVGMDTRRTLGSLLWLSSPAPRLQTPNFDPYIHMAHVITLGMSFSLCCLKRPSLCVLLACLPSSGEPELRPASGAPSSHRLFTHPVRVLARQHN